MLRRILAISVVVTCFATGASGYIGQQSAAMNGTSFNGIELQGTSFQGATLQGVNMQGIQLQGMSMQGASLQGINIRGVETKAHTPLGQPVGAASNSPIVEEIILPAGEAVSLR